MKSIYRAYNGMEFEDFQECFDYEIKKLGVLLLNSDLKPVDNYEDTFYIYVPEAQHAQILIDYAYCIDVDETMWRFDGNGDYLPDEDPILYIWSEEKNIYEMKPYSFFLDIVEAVNEFKSNKN